MTIHRKNLLAILTLVALLFHFSCASIPKPAKEDVHFLVAPHILHQNGKYYFTYQVNTKNTPAVRTIISEKLVKGHYYYFSTGKVSFPEYDHPVNRPVPETEEIIALVKSGNFFWLRADGSAVPLSITQQ